MVDRPLKELAEFYKDIQSTFLWDRLLVVNFLQHTILCLSIRVMQVYVIQDARYVRQLSESKTHTDYIGMDKY